MLLKGNRDYWTSGRIGDYDKYVINMDVIVAHYEIGSWTEEILVLYVGLLIIKGPKIELDIPCHLFKSSSRWYKYLCACVWINVEILRYLIHWMYDVFSHTDKYIWDGGLKQFFVIWNTLGLACCSPWGHKELDTTERLNSGLFSSV